MWKKKVKFLSSLIFCQLEIDKSRRKKAFGRCTTWDKPFAAIGGTTSAVYRCLPGWPEWSRSDCPWSKSSFFLFQNKCLQTKTDKNWQQRRNAQFSFSATFPRSSLCWPNSSNSAADYVTRCCAVQQFIPNKIGVFYENTLTPRTRHIQSWCASSSYMFSSVVFVLSTKYVARWWVAGSQLLHCPCTLTDAYFVPANLTQPTPTSPLQPNFYFFIWKKIDGKTILSSICLASFGILIYWSWSNWPWLLSRHTFVSTKREGRRIAIYK